MPVYSAVEEGLGLWCLVLVAEARIADVSSRIRDCLETPERYARIDLLIDARGATSFQVASDAELDELVHLVRRLRGEGRYRTAYLASTAEMRTNVDVFLQTTESSRARRRGFARLPEALAWLSHPGSERYMAEFLAEMQGQGRWPSRGRRDDPSGP